MSQRPFDLWSVGARAESLRRNAQSDRFSAWTERFLAEVAGPEADSAAPLREGEGVARASRAAESAAFAWLLTEEPAYAQRARLRLQEIIEGGCSWVHSAHAEMYPEDRADLLVAEITKACVNAASWLWPVLDEDLRRALLTVVADRGGRVIFEDAERGCWWADALNSNWTAVLNSALGFAALAWHTANAAEADAWLRRAMGVAERMLDLAADEAAGVEGAAYWLYCFGSLQDLAEALYNTGAPDLYAHPFWARSSRFLPYLALPDLSGWVPYADCGRHGMGGSAFFHGVAARMRDPLAQWFGNTILRKHGGAGWRNLLYFDPSVPETPLDAEPPCRVFGSIQLASFRSGWNADATLMLFKGGSNAWTHTHLDLNSFFIAAGGERLATDPGPEPYSVHLWHSVMPAVSTAWHNCIVVDGAHQRMAAQYGMSLDLDEGGDCYSRLSDHLSSEHLEMIRGDATAAYADVLERAWRDVVYLKPDLFVIFDDLRARPARVQRNFEWLLHGEFPFIDVDGGIEARGERRRLHVRPVSPPGWEYKRVEGKVLPHSEGRPLHCVSLRPYWHHKWNVDPRRSPYPHWDSRGDREPLYPSECRYLVVLQVGDVGVPPRFRVEAIRTGPALGVRLVGERAEWRVLFNPEGAPVEAAEVVTDAEKMAVGMLDGRCHFAAIRASRLVVDGRTVIDSPTKASPVG